VVSSRAKIFDGRKNICLQHKYHTKIDDHIEKTSGHMRTRLIAKLTSVLEKTLGKLSSFDEGSVTGMLLGFATKKINVTGSGVDLGKSYMQFVRNNMDTITKRINDDLWVLNVMEKWYFDQVQMISTWLTDRLDKTLIPYQCTCLAHVVKKLYTEYELQGMEEERLNTHFYQQVTQRMATEEATCVLSNAEQAENGGAQGMPNAGDVGDKAAQAGAKAAQEATKMMTKGFGKALGSFF